jgi:hypothetical protein
LLSFDCLVEGRPRQDDSAPLFSWGRGAFGIECRYDLTFPSPRVEQAKG